MSRRIPALASINPSVLVARPRGFTPPPWRAGVYLVYLGVPPHPYMFSTRPLTNPDRVGKRPHRYTRYTRFARSSSRVPIVAGLFVGELVGSVFVERAERVVFRSHADQAPAIHVA